MHVGQQGTLDEFQTPVLVTEHQRQSIAGKKTTPSTWLLRVAESGIDSITRHPLRTGWWLAMDAAHTPAVLDVDTKSTQIRPTSRPGTNKTMRTGSHRCTGIRAATRRACFAIFAQLKEEVRLLQSHPPLGSRIQYLLCIGTLGRFLRPIQTLASDLFHQYLTIFDFPPERFRVNPRLEVFTVHTQSHYEVVPFSCLFRAQYQVIEEFIAVRLGVIHFTVHSSST